MPRSVGLRTFQRESVDAAGQLSAARHMRPAHFAAVPWTHESDRGPDLARPATGHQPALPCLATAACAAAMASGSPR
ncbi:hypothetical protein AWB80_00074 [Caballeronia pedi]|uniref:Uncharacterized protein n=1 Tax=Caballeronia pedi TaxID=1777141 RepID=A0A157Z1V5_9BURK|nr:hypothetical protein AWB80_00074 [Caballeronia pedi]